jgi:hypothetical protein
MRKEFEMTEEELGELLEACRPTPAMPFPGRHRIRLGSRSRVVSGKCAVQYQVVKLFTGYFGRSGRSALRPTEGMQPIRAFRPSRRANSCPAQLVRRGRESPGPLLGSLS